VPSVQENTNHPTKSARRGLAYVFTPKHHGASSDSACWLTELTLAEEFAIFNRADGTVVQFAYEDHRQVADEDGNLYGYELLSDGSLRVIGTWQQQIAEFPVQREGTPWHGYPIWPLNSEAPENRRGAKCQPDTAVFDRMFNLGDINRGQRKRLKKGEWI
jgi:hypothetical protein